MVKRAVPRRTPGVRLDSGFAVFQVLVVTQESHVGSLEKNGLCHVLHGL